MHKKKKEFFRPDEIAWKLGKSTRTVYRLIEDGYLLAFAIRDGGAVVIPRESFEKYKQHMLKKYQTKHSIVPKNL